jgi:hypothetical protein
MPDLLIKWWKWRKWFYRWTIRLQVLEMMGTKMKPLSNGTTDINSEDSKDKE